AFAQAEIVDGLQNVRLAGAVRPIEEIHRHPKIARTALMGTKRRHAKGLNDHRGGGWGLNVGPTRRDVRCCSYNRSQPRRVQYGRLTIPETGSSLREVSGTFRRRTLLTRRMILSESSLLHPVTKKTRHVRDPALSTVHRNREAIHGAAQSAFNGHRRGVGPRDFGDHQYRGPQGTHRGAR